MADDCCPVQLLYDVIHYGCKINPSKKDVADWPLGQLASARALEKYIRVTPSLDPTALKKRRKISHHKQSLMTPSLKRVLLDLCEVDVYTDKQPFIKFLDDSYLVQKTNEIWARQLMKSPAVISHSPAAFLPIQFVEFENTQLYWKRENVPLCARKHTCAALNIDGNQGCLHVCLSPEQQRLLDTGHHPELPNPGLCLLCIRQDLQSLDLQAQGIIGTNGHRLTQPAQCIAPFQNLVNAPGGYHADAMAVRSGTSSVFGAINVAGVHFSMRTNYDPVQEKYYVDQSKMIWTPPDPQRNHFLR